MRNLWPSCALIFAGCVSGVTELNPNEVDSGSGEVLDAGPTDRGSPRTDAGPIEVLDAGQPATCASEWTTIATSERARGLDTGSFASLPDGFAVTWTDYDENWGPEARLLFLDAEGTPRGPARLIEPGSRVIAADGRFFLGGPLGVGWFEVDGTPGPAFEIGPFYPAQAFGDRVFGRIPVDASDARPAIFQGGQVELLPAEVGFEAEIVFGPDRFVVVDRAMSGATARLYVFGSAGPALAAEYVFAAEEIDGEIWIPTDLAGGTWNESAARFELLFAVNVANGRFFGAKHFTLEGPLLGDAAPLPDQLSRITHGSLLASVAANRGSVAIAYQEIFSSENARIQLVVNGQSSTMMLARTVRSGPLLAPTLRGFALVAPGHSADSATEDLLRMRCF